MKLTEKNISEIYEVTGNMKVRQEYRFSSLPRGGYTDHSWAGQSGSRVNFRPVLMVGSQVFVGRWHPNYSKEYSENGRYGGESDHYTGVADLCCEYGDDLFLVGLVVCSEHFDYNEADRQDDSLILFQEVSELAELLKAKEAARFKMFAESVMAVYALKALTMEVEK